MYELVELRDTQKQLDFLRFLVPEELIYEEDTIAFVLRLPERITKVQNKKVEFMDIIVREYGNGVLVGLRASRNLYYLPDISLEVDYNGGEYFIYFHFVR